MTTAKMIVTETEAIAIEGHRLEDIYVNITEC